MVKYNMMLAVEKKAYLFQSINIFNLNTRKTKYKIKEGISCG